MGRTPCCEKVGLNRGKWTAEEDQKLVDYINNNGEGSWRSLPKNAGLLRCGKSCRLRWINYLRTDVKRGNFTQLEEETIVKLHKTLGNRWSLIASHLTGRTDNEIKNYWNSHLSRKIYRYRYIGESTLSASEMIKVVKKKNKIKKHSSNAAPPESRLSGDDPSDAAPAPQAGVGKDLGVLEPSRPNEEGKSDPASSCDSTMGWLDELMLSPNDAHEMEMLGPWYEVDDEMLMHLRYFLEDETTNECQNEGDGVVMGMDNKPTSEERDSGGGFGGDGSRSSSSDTGDVYACLSPLASYSNGDVEQWDHIGVGNGLNLWNEEDDISIWS